MPPFTISSTIIVPSSSNEKPIQICFEKQFSTPSYSTKIDKNKAEYLIRKTCWQLSYWVTVSKKSTFCFIIQLKKAVFSVFPQHHSQYHKCSQFLLSLKLYFAAFFYPKFLSISQISVTISQSFKDFCLTSKLTVQSAVFQSPK